MNDFYTRRFLVRGIAFVVGGFGFVVWLLVKSCWAEVRSPCTHAVTAGDLSTLKDGTWKTNYHHDAERSCNVTYAYAGLDGMAVDVELSADRNAYDLWTKSLRDPRALRGGVPDAVAGTSPEVERSAIVIRRPQGAIRLWADTEALTAAQLEQLAGIVAARFGAIDDYFGAK